MYENIAEASEILGDTPINNNDFTLDVYPSSQPIYKGLVDSGYVDDSAPDSLNMILHLSQTDADSRMAAAKEGLVTETEGCQ